MKFSSYTFRQFYQLVLILFVLSGFSGCGCNQSLSPAKLNVNHTSSATLWQLKIVRNETTLFTGLLALHFQTDSHLNLVLLDTTGITLLKAILTENGTLTIQHNLIPAKFTAFPKLLARALTSIYFTRPTDTCSGLCLSCITSTSEGTDRTLTKTIGPFTQWQTRWIYDTKNAGHSTAIHWRNNFPSVTVLLHATLQPEGTR